MRWVIGDVHGMLRPLEALIDAIDDLDESAELLFVGDYVNRGPDSRGVLDLLSDIDGARFIRGNHDDVFDLLVNGTCYAPHPAYSDPVGAFSMFMQHGLDRTLLSYGVDPADMERTMKRADEDSIRRLMSVVPKSHRAFIRSLPVVIEYDDLFIAHGLVDPNESPDRPSLSTLLERDERHRRNIIWGRYTPEQILQTKAWQRPGFFGHTPVDTYPEMLRNGGMFPAVGPMITPLDNACALQENGCLTAVCPDARSMLQVDRRGRTIVGSP